MLHNYRDAFDEVMEADVKHHSFLTPPRKIYVRRFYPGARWWF